MIYGGNGGGANPYGVVADLADPASMCLSQSDILPCRHAVGLTQVDAAEVLPKAEQPDCVTVWAETLADCADRAETTATEAAARVIVRISILLR